MLFLAYPVEPTRYGAAMFIQNIAEKDNINVEMLFTSKRKSFTQNAYLSQFLERPLSPLLSRLAREPHV